MTRVFLSYAGEDKPAAARIVQWLQGRGIKPYWFQGERQQGRKFVDEIEQSIADADLFLVLLSPRYLSSGWCRHERQLALQREIDLDVQFIYVLTVVETSYRDAGFLSTYSRLDATAPLNSEKLDAIGAALPLDRRADQTARPPPRRAPALSPARLGLATAAAGLALSSLLGAALGQPQTTKPFTSPTAVSPSSLSAPANRHAAPAAPDRYGCADLVNLPRAIDLPARQAGSPASTTYQVNSDRGDGALPYQLRPSGYMDQAFVATDDTISLIATVPGLDATTGLTEATLVYELWDLDGHRLAQTPNVDIVDGQNTNRPVPVILSPPVAVRRGTVYFLRVINPTARPAVGIYYRPPTLQQLVRPFPVCIVDAASSDPAQAFLDPQGFILSGLISEARSP